MYQPYRSDDDESDRLTSATESSYETDESGSDSEDENPRRSDIVTHEGRIEAMDIWREQANSWINRTVAPPPPPVREGPGAQDTGLGMYNTRLTFTGRRETSVLMVDSLDRDQRIYPLPTHMRLKLPRVYRNVERIDIVQVKMLSGFYTLSASRQNTQLFYTTSDGTFSVTIPDGVYSIQQLIDALTAAFAAVGALIVVEYSCTTGRVSFTYTGTDPGFGLPFQSTLPVAKQGLYSEWGLGWNLGFGGQPVDLTGSNTYVADHIPRLFTDYVFLRMNDTEYMNTVDHTALEDTAVAQDSTGQVGHYFGKLLLNSFGCYAQTFIESPKRFQPVLGRLERLNFDWVDRHGNVLAGPDAASCDWHMTLRIVELVEGPTPTASLALAPITQAQMPLTSH
jgi:hypothetical protein